MGQHLIESLNAQAKDRAFKRVEEVNDAVHHKCVAIIEPCLLYFQLKNMLRPNAVLVRDGHCSSRKPASLLQTHLFLVFGKASCINHQKPNLDVGDVTVSDEQRSCIVASSTKGVT
jgi:hypothetical protein